MDWFDQHVTIIMSDTENHYTWCQDYPLPYQDTTIMSMQHQEHEARQANDERGQGLVSRRDCVDP